jgi:hypothetical protein
LSGGDTMLASPVAFGGPAVSRTRRKSRHRRTPRLLRQAAPVALSGAVAAVALTASPVGDALRRPSGGHAPGGHPQADGTAPGVLLVEQAGGRSAPLTDQGTSRREAPEAARSAGRAASSGTSSADSAPAPHATRAPAVATTAPTPAPDGSSGPPSAGPTTPAPSSSPDPSPTSPAGLPVPLPLPLPTQSSSGLPSLPVPLPTLTLR